MGKEPIQICSKRVEARADDTREIISAVRKITVWGSIGSNLFPRILAVMSSPRVTAAEIANATKVFPQFGSPSRTLIPPLTTYGCHRKVTSTGSTSASLIS